MDVDVDAHAEDLRLAVLAGYAETGSAPSVAELADRLSLDPDEVLAGLRSLHRDRHLVLDESGTRIVMAHPFASVPMGFSVMGRRTLWWGGCAWDSFALPHLLPDEPEMLVATRCPACNNAHAWNVGRDAPPPGGQVAHFLTPVAQIWDDVVDSCSHQQIFCDERCVEDWLRRTGNQRGSVMDLPTLWRLAEHWYEGRLERGYVRREPSAASTYFEQVGLSGPFWGLG